MPGIKIMCHRYCLPASLGLTYCIWNILIYFYVDEIITEREASQIEKKTKWANSVLQNMVHMTFSD